MSRLLLSALAAFNALFVSLAQAQDATAEVVVRRTYFYVGGQYITNSQGIFKVDQMYVEQLDPCNITQPYPMVIWPGAGQTGTNFLNTPDNREGWASYFLREGYQVYLVEQPDRGRSPWLPTEPALREFGVNFTQNFFTAPQDYDGWPQAHLHTQWPGTGVLGDPVFDAFYSTQVQSFTDFNQSETVNRPAGAALLQRIGKPVILMTHSQSGLFGWGIADENPSLVKTIVALEPEGPPFVNVLPEQGFARPYGPCALPLTYDPPVTGDPPVIPTINVTSPDPSLVSCLQQTDPPRKLVNLAGIPVLFLTSEASYHAPYDHCTVTYLQVAGVNVTWYDLPTKNITGNGHFIFMELNNKESAGLVSDWLKDLIEASPPPPPPPPPPGR